MHSNSRRSQNITTRFKQSISTPVSAILVCSAMIPFTQAGAQSQSDFPEKKWVEGQIIVKPRAGLDEDKFERILKAGGGRSKARFNQINAHVVEVPPQAEDAVIKALLNNPNIEYAEKDMLVELSSATPNDPSYSRQWHLPKMQTPNAWDAATGEGVIVAILDTGVEANHPDLVGNLVPGWNVVSNNNDTSPIMWHGTSVAGVVAATSNNATGVSSVAWGAKIMPVRVSNTTDGVAQWSSLANGILWAADHGADVVNMSYDVSIGAYLLNDAAQYFRNKGGVTVVAAGNSNADGGYSDNPYMITVAATDSNDNKSSFSNYGNNVDVSAPGTGIYTTYTNSGYANTSGTSFASPATAGVVALIMSANLYLTPDEVETVLEKSAHDPISGTDWHKYFGWGRVDAAAAVQLAKQTTFVDTQAPAVSIFAPQNNATVSGNVLIEVDASDNSGVTGVDLYANGQFIGRDSTAPYQFSWDSTTVADGSAVFTAVAQDAAGNQATSKGLTVNVVNQPVVQDTTPPTVSIFNPENGSNVSGTVKVEITGSDNIGVKKLALFVDNGLLCSTTDTNSLSCTWNTRKASSGNHIISAIAEDAAGNNGESHITVTKGISTSGGRGK
ncbi:S8 family serine peptidase [Methylomonas sp. MgM2]